MIPKKWWGEVGRGVNKPKFKNEAFEKKDFFFPMEYVIFQREEQGCGIAVFLH